MTHKFIEVRDRGTTIAALAFRISGDDGFVARRAGFQSPMIYLINLSTQTCAYDPYAWTYGRTMKAAHLWLNEHFDEVTDGQVVDVEFILGETGYPKQSEQLTHPL